MTAAPITREPEAPRKFSGNRVSPLQASDWAKSGDRGVPGGVLVTLPTRAK